VADPPFQDRSNTLHETELALRQSELDTLEARRLVLQQKEALNEHAIVAVTDLRGRITHANDKFCAISGYDRSELLGNDHRIVNSGHHPRGFFKALWATIGRGEVWRGEICNRAKDGSRYWVETTIVPSRGSDGEVDSYVAIRAEVTARKTYEQRLTLLASIVEASDDAIVREDMNGRIRSWNAGAERIYRYTVSEAIGQPVELLLAPQARESELSLREGREPFETVHMAKGGIEIDVSVTVAPIRDAEGQLIGWARISRDITERKRLYESLSQAAKLAALGELAGNVAHEVNNPIGIISGKARLLLTGGHGLSEKVSRELEKIVEQSDRVGRLTRGLLDYCRPSYHPKQPTNVQQPLLRALSFVESKASRYGIQVNRELQDGLPAVHANSNELEQIFLNLFLNAIDAMAEEGGTLTVRSCLEDLPKLGGTHVLFTVADTGSGIDEDALPRIFEPFFTTKAGKGTGLGLAICAGLATGHGGSLRASSTPGDGTEFRLLLPVLAPRETTT
jgi:PAS domain S-box-containing protein